MVTKIKPVPVNLEDGTIVTEYESEICRLTYPETENLQEYAAEHKEVFADLAMAEEKAGTPTQSADKIAALMIENMDLKETQDDLLILVTDLIGGAE